jgi:hypothetical protein
LRGAERRRSNPELDDLQRLRLKLHHLDPPRPLRDARAAAAFIRERKIVLSAGRSSLPMLAEAVAGHPIRGSWMADPEVFRIHRLMRKVLRSSRVLTAPLVGGKETLIDASLGPAVQRIAGDRARRTASIRQLPPLARALLRDLESTGEIRMDRWGASPARSRDARLLLARELLATSAELHTESGYHTALVRPWTASSIAVRFGKTARRLDYKEAQRKLWRAAIRSAVVVLEGEARKWFPFGDAALYLLLETGELQRRPEGRKIWLTSEQSH